MHKLRDTEHCFSKTLFPTLKTESGLVRFSLVFALRQEHGTSLINWLIIKL